MKASVSYAQSSQGKFPGIQRLVTALHEVFALISQRESKFQSNLCTTTTLMKWQGDCYIQGDRYIKVNFAENTRQLKILGSCRDRNIQGDRYIQGCYILVCIHWHDKFSRLNLTPETTKFMLQLSTQKEDKLLGQSQVPFTDTINLKKRNKILWQGHNSIVTTFCFKLILSATCPLVYTGLTDSSKGLFCNYVFPLITLHKEGTK